MGEESGWGRRIHTSGSVAITAISSQRMAVLPQNAPNIYDSHTIRGLDKSIFFYPLDRPLNVPLQTKMPFVLIQFSVCTIDPHEYREIRLQFE